MSKKTNLNIRLVVLILFFTTVVEAIGGTYVFLPGQSTLVKTGGFPSVHETYDIEGWFELAVDLDANTASFDEVHGAIYRDGVLLRTTLDILLQMTEMISTAVSDTVIVFESNSMPGGITGELTLTFEEGDSVHLTGNFSQALQYPEDYELDAIAVAVLGCIYYVDAVNGDDDNDGLTPETAFASIQVGIDAAVDGDEVVVSEGTYTMRGNTNLDFAGRAITVRSKNGPELTIIDCQNDGRGFYFHSGEGPNSVLDGFTITNGYTDGSGGAIYCDGSSPTITDCALVANTANNGGAISCFFGDPTITNCVITENLANGMCCLIPSGCGGGVCCIDSSPTITNCTISGNYANCAGGGIVAAELFSSDNRPTVSNCILWGNTPEEIHLYFVALSVTYSNVEGSFSGVGNINIEPCFVDANDFHLQSEAGRWDSNKETWIYDDVNSPCIDAGDPNSDWTAELWPHGKRINMGAYGGTPEASMSLSDAGNIADFNNNDLVDYTDLMAFVNKWLYQEALLPEDIDRNGVVNFTDFAILANHWLWEE